MEEILRDRLYKDEQVLWCGKPEQFKTLDKTNRNAIIGGAIIKAISILGLMALAAYITSEMPGVTALIIFFLLAFGIYIQMEPLMAARKLQDKTQYIFTDQRILRIGAHEASVPYERIKTAALRADEDGHYSLLCGEESLMLKSFHWRGYAASDVITETNSDGCACMVLYALPMDANLKRILNDHLLITL